MSLKKGPPIAQRCRSEKQKKIEDLFSSELSTFKKIPSPANIKFNYLRIFQSLKLRILMEKILSLSLKLNFTPNTMGCYRLITLVERFVTFGINFFVCKSGTIFGLN